MTDLTNTSKVKNNKKSKKELNMEYRNERKKSKLVKEQPRILSFLKRINQIKS